MKTELEKYVNGEFNYTPILNIFMRFMRKSGNNNIDPYDEIGKYIIELYNGNLPGRLSYFNDKIKRKIKDFSVFNKKQDDLYSTISILFLTSFINDDVLKKIFGEPLYHSEFGEGFDGEYNEETDEYDEPENKELYASYFVTINGLDFHIGYDNRGTSIEVEENATSEKTVEAIKKLIDMVKEKI